MLKDYLAIARGTIMVATGTMASSGRSAVALLTTWHPSQAQDLLADCGTAVRGAFQPGDYGRGLAQSARSGFGSAIRRFGLVPGAELDAIRVRLAHLERQSTGHAPPGADSEPDR